VKPRILKIRRGEGGGGLLNVEGLRGPVKNPCRIKKGDKKLRDKRIISSGLKTHRREKTQQERKGLGSLVNGEKGRKKCGSRKLTGTVY